MAGSFPHCEFPESLMVQTTSRCNAACVFCPYPAVHQDQPQGQMSFTLFNKLMQECSRHRTVKSVNLFLMNEPLMDSSIAQRCTLAKELNPQAAVCLWTNGCNLDQGLSHALIHSGLDAIGISIHAMWPETYRQLTGRGDFARVLRRVTRFVQLSQRERPGLRVEVRLVGVQQLLDQREVDEAVAYWRGHGVTGVHTLLGHVSRGGNIPGHYEVLKSKVAGCNDQMPYRMAAVLFDGTVVLCCMDWRREQVLGNISRQSLAQIWTSGRRRQAMARVDGLCPSDPDFICKRCEESIDG